MGGMGIKSVLVTGSEGYIGAVLVPLLLHRGYIVRGIDTCFFGQSPNRGYVLVKKDIRDITTDDLHGVDAVIHLAALSNDPMGALNESLTRDINYLSTVRLADMSKKAGVKRFIFSSSCSIYGKSKNGIVDESSAVDPLTEYARSKIATELELQKYADESFVVGILRNSTVYGYSPMFRSDLVVNNFVVSALTSGEIRVKSDGTPWRPLIDVRDLSSVFAEFLTADHEGINGNVINVGFDENNVQVKDVLSLVHHVFPECSIVYTGEHGSDTRSYKVNFDKFQNLFPGIKQQWSIEKSIRDMVVVLKNDVLNIFEYAARVSVLQSLREQGTVDDNLKFTQ